MSAELDLDDACAGNPLAERQLAELRAEVSTPVLVATNRLADALADARAEIAKLRAEREELRQALQQIAGWFPGMTYGGRVSDAQETARAALAEKGE